MTELHDPIQGEHSDLMGGSSASKRIHCPGSYPLEKALPPAAESEHAARGTALHMAVEYYLLNRDGEDADCLLDMEFYGWTITQELIDTKVKPALKALDEIIADAGGDLDMMIEVKASLAAIIPGAFGTIDVLGKGANGTLYVIDWKFGDGVPVSPRNSYQCGFYGACAMYDPDPEIESLVWGEDGERDKQLNICFVIVQPRVGYPDEPDWQKWETTDEWIEQFLDLALDAHEKMQHDNPPLAEGDWCRWCRANIAGSCPIKTRGVVELSHDIKPGALDEVTLASYLDKAEKVEETINALRAFAHAELERGVKVPGWKLVDKRPSRRYVNEADAEAALRKMSGVKVGDIIEQKLKSPAQLEKSIGKKKYETFAAEHVSMVSSGTTLARDTDSRPDVASPSNALADKLKGALGDGHVLPGAN